LAAQVLYYPATDLGDNGTSWPSDEKFRDGYGLSTKSMLAFSEAYFGHLNNTAEPYLSPLRAESLANLPPALVVTAGFDPLTDSAHAYVERMQAANVNASLAHFPEMIHGFMSIGLFSQQQQAVDRTVDFLQSTVGG
jgi:acetyl esterase